mmetsp:Transcript_11328/g.21265  ORF Transcript_11328/g.21265 Transcript_11328/m.21265 type:complete len:221 (-) Transcript_11328:233-895(-)
MSSPFPVLIPKRSRIPWPVTSSTKRSAKKPIMAYRLFTLSATRVQPRLAFLKFGSSFGVLTPVGSTAVDLGTSATSALSKTLLFSLLMSSTKAPAISSTLSSFLSSVNIAGSPAAFVFVLFIFCLLGSWLGGCAHTFPATLLLRRLHLVLLVLLVRQVEEEGEEEEGARHFPHFSLLLVITFDMVLGAWCLVRSPGKVRLPRYPAWDTSLPFLFLPSSPV